MRLDDCDVPARLARWQLINLFEERGYDKLLRALQTRLPAQSSSKKTKLLEVCLSETVQEDPLVMDRFGRNLRFGGSDPCDVEERLAAGFTRPTLQSTQCRASLISRRVCLPTF